MLLQVLLYIRDKGFIYFILVCLFKFAQEVGQFNVGLVFISFHCI